MSRFLNDIEMVWLRKIFFVFLLTLLGAGAGACNSGLPENSVSGAILLSPGLPAKAARTGTLFIVLAPVGGGPPLAVERLVRVKFPYKYILTKDDLMFKGGPFTGQVKVRARLDSDGVVGRLVRGDYEGRNETPVSIGARGVDVVINKAGTAPPPRKVSKKTVPMRPIAPMSSAGKQSSASSLGDGPTISGTIKIAPSLVQKAEGIPVLFIIARTARPGPPLAVVKVARPRFPFPFTISGRNVMMQGLRFEGRVRITARLDADGNAGAPKPGDMEGKTPSLVTVGDSKVVITVDKAY